MLVMFSLANISVNTGLENLPQLWVKTKIGVILANRRRARRNVTRKSGSQRERRERALAHQYYKKGERVT